ncbi:ABC transporter permease [Candidatus Kaiserbacteria bacterium]|nr:ABC transporter permease [Candidatus Kaiserbacteria bacterium]
MNTIYKLTIAEMKMFVRNKQALFFTLFMPLFIMLIFGYIGFDKPPVIDVGLVTYKPNAPTQQFIDQIKSFPTFKIHEGTLEEEQKLLNDGDLSIILAVPDYLIPTAPVLPEEKQSIIAYENAGQAGQAQTVVSILNQFNTAAAIKKANVELPFTVVERAVNVNNLRYIDFLLPGLIALSIMQMSVFSVAFVFTQYKEKGVLKRILATPMKPIQFVVSNGITRLFISLLQATIFIGLGLLLFKVHLVGSLLLVFLCVLLGAAMFLGLGFTISGLAKTTESVPAIANIVVFPMMFLGGTFFAVSNMPAWLQVIAKVLPLTFFSTALRDVMTKGSGFGDIWMDLVGMLVWGAILITLATVTFRFQERDSG